MRYLLDTTLLLDYIHGDPMAGDLIEGLFAGGHDLHTCDVVTCEALSGGTDDERRALATLLDALDYVATDPAAARWAAESRRRSAATSRRTLADALIAGVAWHLGATVVTRNAADFERQGVAVLVY